MGKMAGGDGGRSGAGERAFMQIALEIGQLGFRKGMQEGLKEEFSLAETGIEVVMDGGQQLKVALRM